MHRDIVLEGICKVVGKRDPPQAPMDGCYGKGLPPMDVSVRGLHLSKSGGEGIPLWQVSGKGLPSLWEGE